MVWYHTWYGSGSAIRLTSDVNDFGGSYTVRGVVPLGFKILCSHILFFVVVVAAFLFFLFCYIILAAVETCLLINQSVWGFEEQLLHQFVFPLESSLFKEDFVLSGIEF